MSQATVNSNNAAPELLKDQEAIVRNAIQEISHIATLPNITMRIIRLAEDPDSTAQDLNNVITNDPALGAAILKVVNSSFYGLPGQIGSIHRAIVLLGMNALKNAAIVASLAKLFRGGQICPSFNARDLWKHSIAVALATRMLAAKATLGLPDEAFLAGLIHDLGIMVEMQTRQPKLIEIIETVDRDDTMTFRDAETAVLGANHEQFGAALCQIWKFPVCFANVTGHHHCPQEVPNENRSLPALVHVADILAGRLQLGYSRTVETDEFDPALLDQLKLTKNALEEVETALPTATEEAVNLMQI